MASIFKCPFCTKQYKLIEPLYGHMEREHRDMLEELPPQQVYFNFKNRYPLNKKFGKSILSGKPTPFNLTTGRYERLADESEKIKYREYFRENMIKRYGKDTILDEPEQQKIMLANRHISGEYLWSDGKTKITYTGTYERRFLEFLDLELGWSNPSDIAAPAPMIFRYVLDNKQHFHIPDFYISSCNLIVNIKSTENKHYRLRDLDAELLQDEAIKRSNFNYIKIVDNKFDNFIKILDKISDLPENMIGKKPIRLGI